LPQEEEKKIEK